MKAPLPPKVSPNAIKCDRFSLYGWWLMITLTASVHLHAQTITWNNNGASTAWYTAASWNPSTASGAWTTSNVAQFQNTGSATTAGINMNTSALSIGAIEVSSARTRVLTIGNSSGTTGNLTLNGATLNSVNNVVLRNASSFALTLQNNETGSGKTMGVVLANSTDNRILLDGSGNIAISSVISGTGRPLSVSGSGSGQLVLSTGNTYTGKTTLLTGGTVSASGESAFGANPGAFVADQIIFNGGALSASGNINFSSNRGITLQAGGGTFNSNGNTITLTNIVTGAGSMTKTGAGTLSLPSAHTHSGDTILTANAGILSLGSVNALQNTTLDTGATGTQSVTFDVAGTNTYNVGGLKGTDALDIGGNTLSVGANSYTGNTEIQAGTLIVGNGGATGELGNTSGVTNNANLEFKRSSDYSFAGVITGTGTVTQSGSGTMTLSAANSYIGGTSVTAGKLAVTNTTGSATGTGNVQASGSVILGTGTIAPASGGSVILGTGATVRVGNDSGDTTGKILTFKPNIGVITTTFQTGSILEFDLFTGAGFGDQTATLSAADLFRTGGSLIIDSGVKLRVNSAMSGFAENDRWKLFDWNTLGGTAPTGTFNTALLELPALTGGLGWDLSTLYTTGAISVVAVPEPSRVALIFLGLVCFFLRRVR